MRIALTTGEPAGIGPEIAIAALTGLAPEVEVTLLGDRNLLARVRQNHQLPPDRELSIEHIALAAPVAAGRLDPRNARYVLSLLDRAIAGALSGEFDAIVTAPVHKGVINDGGVAFIGHTEYLAAKCAVRTPVMLLVDEAPRWLLRGSDATAPTGANPASGGSPLRVALATTHLPLREVAAALTREHIEATLHVIDADLQRTFALAAPRIAVCGLNPHAGENGHLGREEIDVIAPAIAAARARGIDCSGPIAADALFIDEHARKFDVILAMYHDQGLAPFKRATFGRGVNVTLGLPIVRTSVDHGTALDLAGRGLADAGSLRAALQLAIDLVQRRRETAGARTGAAPARG